MCVCACDVAMYEMSGEKKAMCVCVYSRKFYVRWCNAFTSKVSVVSLCVQVSWRREEEEDGGVG